jgi:serine/threonine-protein kinase
VTTDNTGADDPLIGTQVDGRYRVISRLGDGGMGIVYKAEHTHLSKFFALKVMRPTRDAVDRQRFEQEARLAAKIRHKNVVEISDFGVLPTGQPYFVMEFLKGHTLGDAIYEGRIDMLLACHIAAQIASGLQAVHKQNVVHRDLKPDNIFLIDPDEHEGTASEDGDSGEFGDVHFVKIMDFGIAKAVDKNLTGIGMTLGTPDYMSPEQATGDKIDWRSDQYSLGCMLYEMLTGELPFAGKGTFEIMNKHLTETPIPPRKRRPECAAIPAQLEKIVLTMMQKKPAQRYPSMRAVEQALRETVAMLREAPPTPAAGQGKTLVMPPVQDEPVTEMGGPPSGMPALTPDAVDTLRTRSGGAGDKTQPLLPSVRPPQPSPAASERATLVLDVGSRPGAGSTGGPGAGNTPTPKLIDKLAVRVQSGSSLPDIAPPKWWERYAILRFIYGRLWNLWKKLSGK